MSKFWFIAVAVLGACGSSSSTTTTTTTTPTAPAATLCPMDLPGTSVTATDTSTDTSTGGALVFRTTGDLAALRARLDGWAERHNARHAAMGPLPTGAETAPLFDEEDLGPFTYQRADRGAVLTSYRRAPERVFDDPDEFRLWARRAMEAAARRATEKPARPKRGKKRSPAAD